MPNLSEIKTHLNSKEQVIRWPSKYSKKLIVLEYLSEQFQQNKIYTQKEVDSIINKYHTFNDTCLLRRELIMKGHLKRERDCSAYWKV